MKNNIILIINSFLYVFSLTEYLIGIKYINNEYNYKNFWFINLLNIILIPCYFILLKKENLKKYLLKENLKILIYPIIVGILYTIESLFLYYAIDNLPLGFYIILRSSFIIFNIPFFKFLLKKKISNIYICSCFLLVISYILIIKDYIDTNTDNNEIIKYILAIFFCCLVNTIYNNLIEYSIKKNNLISIIDYQIIFQFTYCIIICIPSIYNTVIKPPPLNITTICIFILIAFGLQMFMYNKIFILNNNNSLLSSNILLGGLDLFRRIILLLFAFLFFKEQLNIYINLSLLFFSISSLLLVYEYFQKNNNLNHIELKEEENIII
jgi:drug/metabolite transporter (DMT)-like permease